MVTKTLKQRRLPVGAEVLEEGGVHFRVWAPNCKQVTAIIQEETPEGGATTREAPLEPEKNGYFSAFNAEAGHGSRYRFHLDHDTFPYPDPASRFQPEGPHGPSQVIDPRRFDWTDQHWRGVNLKGQVFYEMHVGTFTREGTFEAAARELPELAELGITTIEMMPVADFPGRFGWGYDGVEPFAPTRLYGQPDDLRRFVDQAHAAGLGVILDVVYNHVGPDGNYLWRFAQDYFSRAHKTDWGDAINFDGLNSAPVREFVLANAAYWIEEFHFDGLRLDATQDIYDDSEDHILAALVRRVREAAGGRGTLVIGENEPQQTRLITPAREGGYGLDALWNDDFHHTAIVAASGRNEAYYGDYLGTPQEFISSAKWGFLYQGQRYDWQNKQRGSPTFGFKAASFVNFLQNHDQVANSFRGDRLHGLTSPGRYKALTALLLLLPGTPLLLQGQEFAASTPFLYFADQNDELARMIVKGRAEFLAQFRSMACPEVQTRLCDPCNPETFIRAKLDFTERERHHEYYQLHRDLLRLRREDPVFRAQDAERLQGAVLGPEAFVLRYFGRAGDDRLLLVNLGRDLRYSPAPEPLLAAPAGKRWSMIWSSEDPAYGGCGTPPVDPVADWRISGHSAVALAPTEVESEPHEQPDPQ